MQKILTLSIPINFGQKKPGVSKGSDELYKSYFKDKFEGLNYEHKTFELKYKEDYKNLFQLQQEISAEKENYFFSIFLGGDHSLAMATISGLYLNSPKEKCVIWIDAHTDCNNLAESKTGNLHGTPVAGLLGDLEEPFDNYKCLDYNEICYIGTRSVDDYEKKYIKKHNILNLSMEMVNKDIDNVIAKLNDFIGDKEIHISFDVDVMDPEIISSTGTPEISGMKIEQMKKIFDILKKYDIKSMDIVEFNPELGNVKKSKQNLFNLLDYFFA